MKKFRVLEEGMTTEGWEKNVNSIYISNEWSSGFPAGKIPEFFKKSVFFLAVQGECAVGFARGFSDDYIVTHLTELLVHKDFQRRGIGENLLRNFVARYSHTAIYTESLQSSFPFFQKSSLTAKSTLIPLSRKASKQSA